MLLTAILAIIHYSILIQKTYFGTDVTGAIWTIRERLARRRGGTLTIYSVHRVIDGDVKQS
jgi:hypothetical protein